MKWFIPAKTFLLGEYSALAGASAILLTTTPCFQLKLSLHKGLTGIHPKSPAGIWWQQQKNAKQGLSWYDPYAGCGGLGASSAQFLGCYLANCCMLNKTADINNLLQAYYQSSSIERGLKPSGYDLIAQSQQGCVFINKQKKLIHSYTWPFTDLAFFLIHTGVKLATHHYLRETTLPQGIADLSFLAEEAKQAFEHHNSSQLISSIKGYQQKLTELNLVAKHSLLLMNQLKKYPEILAIKGCGALGADVLLLLTAQENAPLLGNKLKLENQRILATEQNINLNPPIIKI